MLTPEGAPQGDETRSGPGGGPAADPTAPAGRGTSAPATGESTPAAADDRIASTAGEPSAPTGLRGLLAEHLRPTFTFLLVGGMVFLLDTAMYNLLVFWSPSHGWGEGLMHSSPLLAKLLTIAAASCLTYLGNRLLTFGDRPRPDTARSIALFVLINLIAAGLQLSCLGFSRYVLGLDSVLADNISGTFIGQIVSTSFRYVTYGRFVFPKR